MKKSLNRLFFLHNRVDERRNRNMLNKLIGLISIKSIAADCTDPPYGEGVKKAGDYVLDLCSSLGFETSDPSLPYKFAQIGHGDELIGILCHIDTVPEGSGWHHDPFVPVISDGKLYGRGAVDDKGPAIACVAAMKNILDSGRDIDKRIRIIFGQCEETGTWTDMDAYLENEETPSYGFTPDGDFPAIYAEKGILLAVVEYDAASSGLDYISSGSAPNMVPDVISITAEGESMSASGKAAHGCAPWLGENAADNLIDLLGEKIRHIPFLQFYKKYFYRDIYGAKSHISCSDDLSGSLTINPGMIRCENGFIRLYLDIRYPVTESAESVKKRLCDTITDENVRISFIHHQSPVYVEKDDRVLGCLLDAYRAVSGDMTEPVAIGGGTYARAMKNIIAFGPNFPGHENTEHMPDEYILINDFYSLIRIYQKALENLLDM